MAKHGKKLHCICKGKNDRVHVGIDHQKHIARCPIAIKNKR